jgi:glycerol-3-phosphate dehydrogenase (NAD(P)+)
LARIAVIGAGGWGTAMAILLKNINHEVNLFARRSEFVDELVTARENRTYLPGIHLPEGLKVTGDLDRAVHQADVVVIAVPSHGVMQTARNLASILTGEEIVSLAKGLEKDTFLTHDPGAGPGDPPGTRFSNLCSVGTQSGRGSQPWVPTATVIAPCVNR